MKAPSTILWTNQIMITQMSRRSALDLFEQLNCIDWIHFCYIRSAMEIAFLVPDSCRVMIRDGNSIRAEFIEDSVENDIEQCLFQLFSGNLAVVLDFLTLQDKHNIHTLLGNMKFISTRCKFFMHIQDRLRTEALGSRMFLSS